MPVSIPPFTNVPAPTDPVQSAWAQDITQFAVDLYQARPDDPGAVGELWYDTDDAGSSFPNMPRGYVGHAAVNTPQTINTAATWVDITGASVTWTADPSRRYRTTVIGTISKVTAAGQVSMRIIDGPGTNHKAGGVVNLAATNWTTISMVSVEEGVSGATTRKVQGYVDTAGFTVAPVSGYHFTIIVEDIGAAGVSGGGVWTESLPKGRLGSVNVAAADQSGITSAVALTGFSVPFTMIAGRKIRVYYTVCLAQVTAAGSQVLWVSVDGAAGQILSRTSMAAGEYLTVGGFTDINPAAGARTVGLMASTSAGTLTVPNQTICNGRLSVDDVGLF